MVRQSSIHRSTVDGSDNGTTTQSLPSLSSHTTPSHSQSGPKPRPSGSKHTRPAPIIISPPLTSKIPSLRDGPSSSPSAPLDGPGPRSPSPSRRRAFAARELDPLLANLSPMATLEALKASDAVDKNASSEYRLLADSIANVQPTERALGIRAAFAAKKLREWYTEVEVWEAEWVRGKGFDVPEASDEPGKASKRSAPKSRAGAKGQAGTKSTHHAGYWGSLPAETVVEHECRLNEIQDEMEALELEELKAYVRKAHLLSRGPTSASPRTELLKQAEVKHRRSSSYNKLDDFTVVITATIMQALPYLSRLSSLIETWQTRLLVLRRVPRFLHLLVEAKAAMSEAQEAIDDDREVDFTRGTFYATRDVLRARNNALAETLDSMLDILEGRPDSIPDDWINEMEFLELTYQDWVADAEDAIMNNILGARQAQKDARLSAVQESEEEEHESIAASSAESENPVYDESSDKSITSEYHSMDQETDLDEEIEPEQRPAGATYLVPEVREPNRPLSLATVISADDRQPVSATLSTTSEVSDSDIKRHGKGSFDYRRPSATYSAVTDSPELSTANAVEYFNVPSSDETALAMLNRPALLEVSSRTSSDRRSAHTIRELSPADSQRLSARTVSREPSSVRGRSASPWRRSVQTILHQPTSESENDGRESEMEEAQAESEEENSLQEVMFDSTSEQSAPSQDGQYSASEANYADVEDGTEESGFDEPYSPLPLALAEGIRDEAHALSLRSQSSAGMPIDGRSRASTLNTYASWSDHSDSEGDFEGGYKSYGRKQLPVPKKQPRTKPKSRVMQAQVDPSFSYDDVFDSIVQPLSQPGSPGSTGMPAMEPLDTNLLNDLPLQTGMDFTRGAGILGLSPRPDDDQRSISSHVTDFERAQSRVDYTKRPSLTVLRTGSSIDSQTVATDSLPRSTLLRRRTSKGPDQIQTTAKQQPDHTEESPPSSESGRSKDQLTEQISTMLTRIPVPIRLYSKPRIDTSATKAIPDDDDDFEPPGSPVTDPRTPLNSNPPELPVQAALTLAPAPISAKQAPSQYASRSGRSSQSEIKLYHLHQPGRAKPIKLHIRLVGEGAERVMVRVGGGWSDLEEYLKEYALHHVRTAHLGANKSPSISRGASLDLVGLDDTVQPRPGISVRGDDSKLAHSISPMSSPLASPGFVPSPLPSPGLNGPPSETLLVHSKEYVSRARRHVSASGFLATSKTPPGPYASFSQLPSSSVTDVSPPIRSFPPPSPSPLGNSATAWASPPGSSHGSLRSGRRPSTSSLVSALTQGRSWNVFRPSTPVRDNLAPAGPATASRTKDISPRKKAWVDGMMQQARRASGGPGPTGGVSGTSGRADLSKRPALNPPRSAKLGGPLGFGAFESSGSRPGSASGVKRVFLRKSSSKRGDV